MSEKRLWLITETFETHKEGTYMGMTIPRTSTTDISTKEPETLEDAVRMWLDTRVPAENLVGVKFTPVEDNQMVRNGHASLVHNFKLDEMPDDTLHYLGQDYNQKEEHLYRSYFINNWRQHDIFKDDMWRPCSFHTETIVRRTYLRRTDSTVVVAYHKHATNTNNKYWELR